MCYSMLNLGKFLNWKTSGISKQTWNTGLSVRCYGSGVFTLRTSNQATRFELIITKQETEQSRMELKIHFEHCLLKRKW